MSSSALESSTSDQIGESSTKMQSGDRSSNDHSGDSISNKQSGKRDKAVPEGNVEQNRIR